MLKKKKPKPQNNNPFVSATYTTSFRRKSNNIQASNKIDMLFRILLFSYSFEQLKGTYFHISAEFIL